MAKKKVRKCSCVKKVNKELQKEGLQLTSSIVIDFESGKVDELCPMIQTEWADQVRRAKKPRVMVCSYCPFCGKKLER